MATAARACVTGIGLVSALGNSVEATYAALWAGRRAARALDQIVPALGLAGECHPAGEIDPCVLGVGRAQLRYMSPAMTYLLAAMGEAVAKAGLAGDRPGLRSFGLAIAATGGERTTASEVAALRAGGGRLAGEADSRRYAEALLARSPLSALRAQPGLLAGILSERHGTQGPCLTLIGDEHAGALAIDEACQAITDGWCERWIVGAAFHLDDPWMLLEHAARRRALGSAAAVLVLESDVAARRRDAPRLAELAVVDAEEPDTCQHEDGAVPGDPRIEGGALAGMALHERLGATVPVAVPLAVTLAIRAQAGAPNSGGTRAQELAVVITGGRPSWEKRFLILPPPGSTGPA